jgi:hypothetical protein
MGGGGGARPDAADNAERAGTTKHVISRRAGPARPRARRASAAAGLRVAGVSLLSCSPQRTYVWLQLLPALWTLRFSRQCFIASP